MTTEPKFLLVTMPNGSVWGVPLSHIALNRAQEYASEFGGDIERSLAEDTMPLFDSSPREVADWASNNMNWADVSDESFMVSPAPVPDFQEGWVNGDKKVSAISPAQFLKFSQLWVGDRFEVGNNLWTKISHNTARQHCKSSRALAERGYGYIGDAICSFEVDDEVLFTPA